MENLDLPAGKKLPLISSVKTKLNNFSYSFRNKRRIISTVLSILVLAGSLGVGAYLVQQRQSTKTQAANPELSFSLSNSNPAVGDTFIAAVAVNTHDMSVSAADIRVRFEKAKLEALEVLPLDFLPTVLIPAKIDPTTTDRGLISIVLGAQVDQTGAYPKTGTGSLFQITFRAKASGATQLTFGDATAIAAIGSDTNVVGAKNPITLTIGGAGGTSPSPTVTAPPTEPPPTEPPPTAPPPTEPPPSSPGTGTGPDINGDGSINLLDINEIIKHYGQAVSEFPQGNVNGDSAINILDINEVIKHYGE